MGQRLLFSFAVLGVLCCVSLQFSGDWSIDSKHTPSSTSQFYVLHDWQDTFSGEQGIAPLPAAKISDIMLKTMGILKDGANWPGVLMGNLFSRPLATALFLVDGISPESSMGSLSSTSFGVDQTGLTGCTCGDTKLMFGGGDNVAQHLSDLFDQDSQTNSVSANVMAAQASSANGAYTAPEQLDALVADIKTGSISLSKYGLEEATSKLDLTNEVDSRFVAELVLIKQTIEQLKELTAYVSDSSPDVFVFTISALEDMEGRYGKQSDKMNVATAMVKQVIQESSDALVDLYDGQVLVQALVLEWNRPAMDTSAPELDAAFTLLQPYLAQQDRATFFSSLPRVIVKQEYNQDPYLCTSLREELAGTSFYAHCPRPEALELPQSREAKSEHQHRLKRQADPDDLEGADSDYNLGDTPVNVTAFNIAEGRSNIFSAVFLITLFITVSLGLALYAVSVMLWNMDPGRDSVIYRQVSDPAIRMQ